jgi:GWxTD domain-containing protein
MVNTMKTFPTLPSSNRPIMFRALLLMLLLPVMAAAQGQPMNFVYDYSSFAYSDSSSMVEFSFQFSDRGIVYRQEKEGSIGKLFIRLVLRDTLGNHVTDAWIISALQPEEGAEPRSLMGNRKLELKPGVYSGQVYYEDVGDRAHRDSSDFTLMVRNYTAPRLQLSDVQIASEISPGDETGNQFYKNGYLILPNVMGHIAEPFLVLNTYRDVYNGHRVPTSEYAISYGIADSTRTLIYQKDEKRPRPTASGVVEVNSIYLGELPSGEYYLVVKAHEGLLRSASDSSMVVRPFSVYNPEKDAELRRGRIAQQDDPTLQIDPRYGGLKEEELDLEFKKVKPIATEPEKNIYEQLQGTDAKGRFLTGFWLRRDPSPGTPENENFDGYEKLLKEARGRFTSPMTPNGWDSDRGRVLLQYGKPDNQDRHFQDYNRKPYEIWTYSQMGYTFVFVDRTQTGTYPLVHSTAPGEFRFEDWEREYAMLDKHMDE